jgi:hypothetical protein
VRRAVLLLLLVKVAIAQPISEPTPPVDPKVQVHLSLIGKRTEFHIGEVIPIKLSFRSRVKDRYQLNEAQYDRSGRMDYEHFLVTPPQGAIDPSAEYFSDPHIGGGLTGFTFLTNKPWTIQLNLNEWVRFTKPGKYKLRISSNRVEVVDPSSPHGTSPITAMSNEVTLKILPVDPAWERRAYQKAVAQLEAHPSAKEDEDAREKGLETLRFLGTSDATRELVKQMRGESPGRLDFICYIGLISSPERAAAREALDRALADPDHPIDGTFLDALTYVESDNVRHNATRTEDEQKALERVVGALPNKRGKALRVSLYAVLEHVWIPLDKQLLQKETVQKLVSQLISLFDQLRPNSRLGYSKRGGTRLKVRHCFRC